MALTLRVRLSTLTLPDKNLGESDTTSLRNEEEIITLAAHFLVVFYKNQKVVGI
ncbi:MAG: hypothetical protein K0S11_350 [Gammaproteobacteria bacterium]|jgi:hypothetical protein|nr:hypothetical protein [Gammaproteobacteria bacterium]